MLPNDNTNETATAVILNPIELDLSSLATNKETAHKTVSKRLIEKIAAVRPIIATILDSSTFGRRYSLPGYTKPGTNEVVVDPNANGTVTISSLEAANAAAKANNCYIRKIKS